jgi:hypothetical protein
MPSRGDMLLYALSARRQMPWSGFTAAADAVYLPDQQTATDMRHARFAIAVLGDSLGHWDFAESAQGRRLYIAPPVLAALPLPGLPKAVLCGSRSPDTVPALNAAAGRLGKVEIRTSAQEQQHSFAPSRIEVSANTTSAIAALASAISVRFETVPPAWALTTASCSVEEYLETLHWSEAPELNWPRRDFDPDHLRLGQAIPDQDQASLRLSAYEHPSGWTREDRLWLNGQSAVADRNWGRYAVLAGRDSSVLRYDRRSGIVSVPRQAPLPKLLARALTLCSGKPPRLVSGEGLGYQQYGDVPVGIFETVAAKLGIATHRETASARLVQ